ncbi:HEAT repeat domain-containing protein [Methylobacter tundripaludum]|uniref:PBS lyase HEAT domain protein repeat-containing protein n=1 Tax=Methylobacter tundripaludum (strain ATCC BAA-1195 / DSM 17260 / SV96) TaxID=697282 RepID=G3IWW0_METTV|nr:HEAT repeat domain-containing protein [Methylobacter tundripaludum]EGW23315.1 PBS lyase HEAT domain protein repeat-containing protein [Methylobacter tundripaludum SV96]
MPIIKQHTIQTVDVDERLQPRDFAGLTAELAADNSTARRWAARDLAEFPEAAGILVERLKREEDTSVREAILTTLARLGDPAAVAGLVECLRSEDASLRNEVIEAMKELPDEVAPIMSELLEDHDPDVRIFAVNILESLCHPQVEAWLISVIEKDAHVNVCATALDLLSEVGTLASRPALQQLKARFADEPYIGFTVDLAIKRIDEN